VPGEVSLAAADSRPNEPVHGVTSLDFQMLAEAFESTVGRLHRQLAARTAEDSHPRAAGNDPQERLAEHFRDVLGLGRAAVSSERLLPLLFVVSGDIDPRRVQAVLDKAFGQLPVGGTVARPTLNDTTRLELESNLDRPVAQEQLGYVVRAPGPREPGAAAWWMTLYILSHGYEGRLGKEAISRRGLVYYIDSAYRSDGVNGWVTLSIGVDPAKLPAMRDLLRNELQQLQSNPPTQEEIDEAGRHLLGRQISAAQSNQELAERLAREWLWYGELLSLDAWQSRLSGIDREDVLEIVPAFVSGSIVAVRNPRPAE
jgi:predicted Zn-dependent peptidase